MTKKGASIPSELREISDEDELTVSSICPRQINSSIELPGQSLKLWTGHVRTHTWTDLPKCMKFISKHGCTENRSFIWTRHTLELISSTATSEQLIHILNGYADLYKLVLYFVKINDGVPISSTDIRTFGGTSSKIKQQKRHRNIAFIMFNADNSLFAPLYVTHNDGHPQTCFASDDENIIDHITESFSRLNQEISQRSTEEVEHTGDNEDATEDTDESQKMENLDEQISLAPPVQNEVIPTTTEICENNIPSDLYPNSKETNADLEGSVTNDCNSSSCTDLTEQNVRQNLDCMEKCINEARRLRGEIEDVPSMETDDRGFVNNEALKDRESISHSGMINMTNSKLAPSKRHVRSSNNRGSNTAVYLLQSSTTPTIITAPNGQTISRPVQEYDPPTVVKDPKPHRRVRMLSDLAKNDCPFVQAGEGKTQRSYPEIEVSPDGDEGLHIRVKTVTENGHLHPCTTVVPADASVDQTLLKDNNERVCLKYNPDSFDPVLECVYLPITPDDRKNRRKKIKVHLFNWKQYGPTIKEVIEHENLRLCKLEFRWCIRLNAGEYQLVSLPSYTTVIEQADGDVTIDPTMVTPKQLCELGGEKIIVPLSVACPKKGFSIKCNGTELKVRDFSVLRKELSFTSPPKKDKEIDELHLIIERTEYIPNSSERTENQLYEDFLPYVIHGQCTHNFC